MDTTPMHVTLDVAQTTQIIGLDVLDIPSSYTSHAPNP